MFPYENDVWRSPRSRKYISVCCSSAFLFFCVNDSRRRVRAPKITSHECMTECFMLITPPDSSCRSSHEEFSSIFQIKKFSVCFCSSSQINHGKLTEEKKQEVSRLIWAYFFGKYLITDKVSSTCSCLRFSENSHSSRSFRARESSTGESSLAVSALSHALEIEMLLISRKFHSCGTRSTVQTE